MRTPPIALQLAFVAILTFVLLCETAAGAVYPTISVTTDYRYNGVSYSDGQPVPQVSAYWTAPQRFYFGIWSSEIDFKDPGGTSVELDLYAGRDFQVGKFRLTFETLYTAFPDQDVPGPTYDFVQLKARARRLLGAWTIGMQTAWTPEASYGAGPATRVAAELIDELKPWLSLSGNVGRRWADMGDDRTYWDVGITLKRNIIGIDIRYSDTNLDPAGCRLRCDATVTGTVSINFW